jgi:hypothetical protein
MKSFANIDVKSVAKAIARRLRAGAVVSVLGLLLGMQGFAPDTQGIVHAQTSYENWMGDLAPVIGQRPLRQVVIPGSHDAATYDGWDIFTQGLAEVQSVDITSQLNGGSRWFDLRFTYYDWPFVSAGADYWTWHGIAVSSQVRMGQVLAAVVEWSQRHPREIVMLNIAVGSQFGSDQNILNNNCAVNFRPAVTAGLVLQPSMVPPGMTL